MAERRKRIWVIANSNRSLAVVFGQTRVSAWEAFGVISNGQRQWQMKECGWYERCITVTWDEAPQRKPKRRVRR